MKADDPDLQRPDEEAIKEITEKTRVALEKSVTQKVAAAMPVRAAHKLAPAQYIRYTPSQQGVAFNSGAKQRGYSDGRNAKRSNGASKVQD
ncbi:SNW domain-containing protein 1 [Saguinus oedipus]|uniref:SNW domain-containing protein 1 n=1 Tax=Saguinus oedipus TaxID=9490 RepID=A0ABQ9WDA2_SAGOE|nr:SNW domain-containing protein 1 [Saguinus oedipus]